MSKNKIRARYKPIIKEGYEHKPIMEINNIDTDGRMCNCCKCHEGIDRKSVV